jgi:hypothetical protein
MGRDENGFEIFGNSGNCFDFFRPDSPVTIFFGNGIEIFYRNRYGILPSVYFGYRF